MKNLLRFGFSFFLVGLVFANTGFAYDNAITDFTDVDENHPYYESVNSLHYSGIIEGYEDGGFHPNNEISRAEFLKIVMMRAEIETYGSDCFSDVKGEWFAKYICSASEKDLVKGYGDGTFKPHDLISFAEAGKILSVVFEIPVIEDDTGIWYSKYVKAVESRDSIPFSITGFGHEVTRGEMAEMTVHSRWENLGLDNSLSYEDLLATDGASQKEIFADRFSSMNFRWLESAGVPDGVDLATFKSVKRGSCTESFPGGKWCTLASPDLYRDANRIYVYPAGAGDDPKLIVLEGADADTFQVISNIDYTLVLDKNHFYSLDEHRNFYQVSEDVTGTMELVYQKVFKDGENVYYYDVSNRDFVKIDGIDESTFAKHPSSLRSMFVDKDSLYFYDDPTMVRLDLDMNSFEVVSPSYSGNNFGWIVLKDKNGVYYYSHGSRSLHPFDDADPDSFEVKFNQNQHKDGAIEILAHDKYRFYTLDFEGDFKKHDIDMETYEKITTQNDGFEKLSYFIKDKDSVYYVLNLEPISWADPETFEVYGYKFKTYGENSAFLYGKNGNDFWVYNSAKDTIEVRSDIDFETFVIVSDFFDGLFAKDKSHVWEYNEATGVLKELDDIDPKSFERIGEYGFFKDNSNVFYLFIDEMRILEGADPDTFELYVFEGSLYLMDKSSVWLADYGTDDFVKIEDADPDEFFDRGLDEEKDYIILEFMNLNVPDDELYPAVTVNLETGETYPVLENLMTQAKIISSGGDLFIDPSSPVFWPIAGEIAQISTPYHKITMADAESAEFNSDEIGYSNGVGVDSVFLLKTLSGTIYKFTVLEHYPQTIEMVVEYALVE